MTTRDCGHQKNLPRFKKSETAAFSRDASEARESRVGFCVARHVGAAHLVQHVERALGQLLQCAALHERRVHLGRRLVGASKHAQGARAVEPEISHRRFFPETSSSSSSASSLFFCESDFISREKAPKSLQRGNSLETAFFFLPTRLCAFSREREREPKTCREVGRRGGNARRPRLPPTTESRFERGSCFPTREYLATREGARDRACPIERHASVLGVYTHRKIQRL